MTYLAIDFGGGSGRVIAGTITDEKGEKKLTMQLVHRFQNRQVRLGNHVYWDFPALFEDMKTGLKKAAQLGLKVSGIAIDTWGVDFGFIDRDGNLVGNPVCYRDARTNGMAERFFADVDRTAHYAVNGTQVMEINTLFQLLSLKLADSPQLQIADKLLFTPDLFSYFLTGEANTEYTIASTSEMLDARKRDWDWELIDSLGLPRHLFCPIVMPGTVRGRLRKDIAEETGLGEVDVIAVGSHDTASAVAAVPATDDEQPVAFISSGTWSLLGVEINEPILTEEARRAEFTNEGGIGGKITFLQNITGLWFIQRLMAEWKEEGDEQQYDILLPAAEKAVIDTVIPVDDAAFQNPPSMQQAIIDYCNAHNLTAPTSKAETTRIVLQSLAAKYAEATSALNAMLPSPIKKLHIIGGGSQNKLLNRLTEEALGVPVEAGPVEATGIGNILTQALAKGEVSDIAEMRRIVKA
ncbi:rhamnulokinase family protein [uncultured Prevotella sp.]|uniref:rhamnulokinase n=1 Tax=uncultured Prevotella sp. TaxID=159272 RepID=UPI0027E2EA22|nr:rhamnulokinase family protein [uncultured Prevotella sp.]